MKRKETLIGNFVLLLITFSLCSFDLPTGWIRAGNEPDSYEMGIDKGAGPDGNNAATLQSLDKKIKGFGTLMQECKADKYLGKRIKMTGYIKSESISGWAGLWLRVDQPGSEKPLSFDNMQNRKIQGTTPWTKYEIVLDVPSSASILAYGVLLDANGKVWFDNITFEVVGTDVKTTGSINGGKSIVQDESTNLGFEK